MGNKSRSGWQLGAEFDKKGNIVKLDYVEESRKSQEIQNRVADGLMEAIKKEIAKEENAE